MVVSALEMVSAEVGSGIPAVGWMNHAAGAGDGIPAAL